jgi:hypothetical protein
MRGKVDEARASLGHYLLALTQAERRRLPKMDEKTIGFVERAYDFARQNLNFAPPYLEADAFAPSSPTPAGCGCR